MPIKTIIFDFGDVLVTDTSKVYKNKFSRRWSSRQTAAFHKINHLDDMGKLTMDKFCALLSERVTPAINFKQTKKIITDFKLFKKNWRLAQKLTKRYQVIILSNNSRQCPKYISKKLHISFNKTPFVNSSIVKSAKPHLKIYRYAIRKFRVSPAATIFIDDRKRNIVPAKKLGLTTVWYRHGTTNLERTLKHLGVNI